MDMSIHHKRNQIFYKPIRGFSAKILGELIFLGCGKLSDALRSCCWLGFVRVCPVWLVRGQGTGMGGLGQLPQSG